MIIHTVFTPDQAEKHAAHVTKAAARRLPVWLLLMNALGLGIMLMRCLLRHSFEWGDALPLVLTMIASLYLVLDAQKVRRGQAEMSKTLSQTTIDYDFSPERITVTKHSVTGEQRQAVMYNWLTRVEILPDALWLWTNETAYEIPTSALEGGKKELLTLLGQHVSPRKIKEG